MGRGELNPRSRFDRRLEGRLACWTSLYAIVLVVGPLLVCLSACSQEGANIDNRVLLLNILREDNAEAAPDDTVFNVVGVDAEFRGDLGSAFLVRLAYAEDTIYSFWAMTHDTGVVDVWPFGGVHWGRITQRYLQLLTKDSLGIVVDTGRWWESPATWDFIESEKDAGSMIERAIGEVSYSSDEQIDKELLRNSTSAPVGTVTSDDSAKWSRIPKGLWVTAMDEFMRDKGQYNLDKTSVKDSPARLDFFVSRGEWFAAVIARRCDTACVYQGYLGKLVGERLEYQHLTWIVELGQDGLEEYLRLKGSDSLWTFLAPKVFWESEREFEGLYIETMRKEGGAGATLRVLR